MPSSDDLFYLAILYIIAYGLGSLVSKFWSWLRLLIIFISIVSFYKSFNFSAINMPTFLVIIVPVLIFVYPSIKIMLQNPDNPLNKIFGIFTSLFDTINSIRYRRRRKHQFKAQRQAEEEERQREFEREEAEREARRKARQRQSQESQEQRQEQSTGEDERKKQERKPPPKADDPYEVLGCDRSMSLEEIHKAYRALALKYAPDRVNHLGEEFQAMANEKFKEINGAWERIRKGRG